MRKENLSPNEVISKLRNSILVEIHPDKWHGHNQQQFDNNIAAQTVSGLKSLYIKPTQRLSLPTKMRIWIRSNSGRVLSQEFDLSVVINSNIADRKTEIESVLQNIFDDILKTKSISDQKSKISEERFRMKEDLNKKAHEFLRQGKSDEALECFREIIKVDCFDELAQTMIELMLLKMEKDDELFLFFDQMKTLGASPMQWDAKKGNQLISLKKYNEALLAFEAQLETNKLLGIEHLNGRVFEGIAKIYEIKGDVLRRDSAYNSAISATEKRISRSETLEFEGDWSNIDQFCEWSDETDTSAFLIDLARLYVKTGDHGLASATYIEALSVLDERGTVSAELLNEMGIYFFEQKEYGSAQTLFKMALKVLPDNKIIQTNLELTTKKVGAG